MPACCTDEWKDGFVHTTSPSWWSVSSGHVIQTLSVIRDHGVGAGTLESDPSYCSAVSLPEKAM